MIAIPAAETFRKDLEKKLDDRSVISDNISTFILTGMMVLEG
jgi:hypothetical protein